MDFSKNLEDFVIVFDLDDTLYPEEDYVISGIKFLEEYIYRMYKYQLNEELIKVYYAGEDFLDYACKKLKLSYSSKESLLWLYRLHLPSIKLPYDIKCTLESLTNMKAKIIILTDGRSITQRLKVNSLGINNIPIYISEDYNSEKPNKKRFLKIEKDFPEKYFVYIADNPLKDFIAPLEMNWICIGANWISNKINKFDLDLMPAICLDSPPEIKNVLIKFKQNNV